MSMASPEIQDLARRLLAFEAGRAGASGAHAEAAHGDGTVQVVEELRLRLIRLAGVDGFCSLLSRALALAQVEAPALSAIHVRADGSLEGFEGIEQSHEARTGQAGVLLVAHLLALLVTFIGEPLTLRLVSDAWPDASRAEADLKIEETP